MEGTIAEDTEPLMTAVVEEEVRLRSTARSIDDAVKSKYLRDNSPEAKLGRRRRMIRAAFAEFMCTLIFFTMVFSVIAHGTVSGWNEYDLTYAVALVSGFQATSVIYTFSSASGAHFNCNISFALWLTGRLSNRRCVVYIAVQLLASVVAMGLVAGMFHGDLQTLYDACSLVPTDNVRIAKVFATEFITTFILTYVAFTVAFLDAESEKKHSMSFKGISDSKGLTVYASTPQSKAGFAPLAIGLVVFSLAMVGGSSGPAFNQNRMFGPAVFSGKWAYFYVYYAADLCGAASASLIAHNLHLLGLEQEESMRSSAAALASACNLRRQSNDGSTSDLEKSYIMSGITKS